MELAIFSSIFVWLPLTIIFFGLLTFFVERDNPITATLVVIATVLLLQFFTDTKPITAILENPTKIIGYFVIYLIAGVFYGGFKWYRFQKALKARYDAAKAAYLRRYDLNYATLSDDARGKMVRQVMSDINMTGQTLPPSISDNKSRVISWMTYWPVSIVWMALDDLFINVWNWLYRRVADLYQAISDRIWADARADFR